MESSLGSLATSVFDAGSERRESLPGLAEGATVKVLMVEDCETDSELALRALRQGGLNVFSRRVDTAPDLREALLSEDWHVVISDFSLPGFTGMEALRIVRTVRADLPLIILSGTIDEGRAVEAMRAGARDYVFKGNLPRLAPAIHREMREYAQRQQARDAEARLHTAEDRFRLAAETCNDVIFEWDLGPLVMYFGDIDSMLGYEPGEFPRTVAAWRSALHPEDRPRVEASLKRALEERATYDVEYRMTGKDEAIYWWSVRGRTGAGGGRSTDALHRDHFEHHGAGAPGGRAPAAQRGTGAVHLHRFTRSAEPVGDDSDVCRLSGA